MIWGMGLKFCVGLKNPAFFETDNPNDFAKEVFYE